MSKPELPLVPNVDDWIKHPEKFMISRESNRVVFQGAMSVSLVLHLKESWLAGRGNPKNHNPNIALLQEPVISVVLSFVALRKLHKSCRPGSKRED